MDVQAIITTIVGGIVAVYGSYVLFVKDRAANKTKAVELNDSIEARIDARIKSELENAYSRIDKLEKKVKDLTEEERITRSQNSQIKDTVKRWFRNLTAWDTDGREGPMPIPNEDDLELLEIKLIK